MSDPGAVVIGAGPGGYVAAIRLAQLGVKTTIIERGPLGGVCLNWGCIPSKAFIQAAKIVEHIRHAGDIGIEVAGEPKVDLKKMRDWKDGIVRQLTSGIGALLEKSGVTIVRGEASFESPTRLTVKGDDGKQSIDFAHAIIATGSRSMEIPGFAYDGKHLISSRHALDLDTVPKELIVIGGGVIGLEIGCYLNGFGTKVTVVELMDQILPGTDPEVVKTLGRTLKKRGVKVMTKTRASGWKKKGPGVEVTLVDAKDRESTLTADAILLSVGRRPNTEHLGLEQAGVRVDKRGFIQVDGQLRTNVAHIHAIGDITGPPQLAHKASKEGLVAAAVIAGQPEAYDVRAMPAAIFTDPEIASVGLTEAEAKEQGYETTTGKFPFKALGKALASRESDGFVKIVANKEDDLVLGVHIIGAHASDLIAEATLAIETGACVEDIGLTVHTHPTMAESLMEAAEAVHGQAIHVFNPSR